MFLNLVRRVTQDLNTNFYKVKFVETNILSSLFLLVRSLIDLTSASFLYGMRASPTEMPFYHALVCLQHLFWMFTTLTPLQLLQQR
jgi:hypothetical protein